jgi:hypothetical protein
MRNECFAATFYLDFGSRAAISVHPYAKSC